MSWKDRLRFIPTKGGLALAFLGFGVFGAAQTTGAGWLAVLMSMVFGTLVTGAIWPVVLARSLRVEVTGPIDAVAGRAFPMTIQIDGRPAGVRFKLPGLTPVPIWAQMPSAGSIQVTAQERGVLDQVTVDVWCSAPFDLFTSRKRMLIDLPNPVYVAPQPIPMRVPDHLLGGSGGDGVGAGGTGPGDMVRSLREYAPGDAMRMVHWRATARRADLVVKELEPPQRPRLALIVDVSGRDAERIAGQAAGLIQSARQEGLPVTLLTFEASGPIKGDVGSTREAGRRLAGAIPGKPPTGPLPDGTKAIRVGSPGIDQS